jgi:hypothetical protein
VPALATPDRSQLPCESGTPGLAERTVHVAEDLPTNRSGTSHSVLANGPGGLKHDP